MKILPRSIFDAMEDEEIQNKVLNLSIEQWNKSFCGTSALDICRKINIPNEKVMIEMEKLCKDRKGTINANVKLFVMIFDTNRPKLEIPNEPTFTHVFFPNKDILTEHFYTSNIVRENHPEYKKRLHQGAHQLQMVLFYDEVLTRYFDHPEFYQIDDSLSGGHIWTKSETPENRYLYVRHGKRRLKSGKTAVAAIFKDLYVMSAEEQRHWHSYEIEKEEVEEYDPYFYRFFARTFEGQCVDFPNPIKDVIQTLKSINEVFKKDDFFKRTENAHFRLPVENTEKSFYDCCSEFYKLVGQDSINQKVIKNGLFELFSLAEPDLIHSESGRPFSSMQLLALFESKLDAEGLFTKTIKAIGKNRIEADHKITQPSFSEHNYVEDFIALCQEFVISGKLFEESLIKVRDT